MYYYVLPCIAVYSKACKRIHYLRVCRTAHLPRDISLTTYITKIRPVLEYASPVWGGLPIYLEEDLQSAEWMSKCHWSP